MSGTRQSKSYQIIDASGKFYYCCSSKVESFRVFHMLQRLFPEIDFSVVVELAVPTYHELFHGIPEGD